MFTKILVAIDCSEESRNIFDYALSLAQATGANLMLLHVFAPEEKNYPNPLIFSGTEYDVMDESLWQVYQQQWQKLEQQGLDLLRSLAAEATAAGVKTDFTQEFGTSGSTICNLAQTCSADLILIGSRGLKGIKEMFLGSVSNYVTHHAPCSVLIVRLTDQTDNDEAASSPPEQTEVSTS